PPPRLLPSPALAVACIALFVALGGVSYGLATGSIDTREIRDNTIRSKDVRNNSIYTRDIRNNDVRDIDIRNGTIKGRDVARGTLTGDNINMRKLGQVPDAAALGGRPAADYALASAPEPVLFVAGVSPAAPGDLAPGFWKHDATVYLQGSVSGSGSLFTLPEGYRPAGNAHFRVPAALPAGETTVTVSASGVVSSADPQPALDGISFRAP
ncbi:MAG TPA: hypothetical protein VHF88_10390, partial [Thermoleophilaceae bacterium]|nr:hypothetical protein [Thermoleophilaceae bacterium]